MLNFSTFSAGGRSLAEPVLIHIFMGNASHASNLRVDPTFGLKPEPSRRVAGAYQPSGCFPPSQQTSRLGSRHGIVMSTC